MVDSILTSTPPPEKGCVASDEGLVQDRDEMPPAHRPRHIRTGDNGVGGTLQVGPPPRDSIPVCIDPFPVDDYIKVVDNIWWLV